jgi:hypothetical protein
LAGPTFSFTNKTSKTQIVDALVEVRNGNGTNWTMETGKRHFRTLMLAPNAGVYATIEFEYRQSGMGYSVEIEYPTNAWRLAVNTTEALTGSAATIKAMQWKARHLFNRRSPMIPMSSLFSTNRTWLGNSHHFVSEEVLDPKSRR